MLYTHAPSTWPTGSNPTPRIAANSSVDSAEPQVPLPRISVIRSRAAGGSLAPVLSSVTRVPSGCWTPQPYLPGRVCQCARLTVVGGVPLLVAPAHGLQGPFRLFPGGVGPEPVFARAYAVVLHRFMP